MTQQNHKPHAVGAGVVAIIQNPAGQILLGLRKGAHCPGTWSFPGGKMELGDSPEKTVKDEVTQETGLEVGVIQPWPAVPYVNTVFASGIQYITLYFTAEYLGGEPVICEPDKCAEWRWVAPNELPTPLFPAISIKVLLRLAALVPRETPLLPKITCGPDPRLTVCNTCGVEDGSVKQLALTWAEHHRRLGGGTSPSLCGACRERTIAALEAAR